MVLFGELEAIALANGADRVGVCSAEPFLETRVELHRRKELGLHADMQFTYRNPDRATDPARSLPGAISIFVATRSYRRATVEPSTATAQIAQYVWEPYYAELRVGLDRVAEHLTSQGWNARVLIDDNALVDRAAAHRAGIAWWGKNANLLIPGEGSRFVIGSVITNADLEPVDEPLEDQCGTCRRCFDSCPTDAIIDNGVIDANRCLAWLVQATGVFPREHRSALGDRIYGCDDCQTSCPPNVRFDRAEEPPATSGTTEASIIELLTLDDDSLLERFGAWYIPRREARYLRRNALVVLGNVGDRDDPQTRRLLQRYIESDDEIERSHAVWAANNLGFDDLVDSVRGDNNALVKDELRAIAN